jgi:hypothetical protein
MLKSSRRVLNLAYLRMVVLFSCCLLIVGLLLFPPWKFVLNHPRSGTIIIHGPYGCVFSPPQVPTDPNLLRGIRYRVLKKDGTIETVEPKEKGPWLNFQPNEGVPQEFHSGPREKWIVQIDLIRLVLPVLAVALLMICTFLFKVNRFDTEASSN